MNSISSRSRLAGSSPGPVADGPQTKLGNRGKQKAGLLDRGAAAGEGRRSSPQLAPDEGMAGQGFGVIAEQKDQGPWQRGREPNV